MVKPVKIIKLLQMCFLATTIHSLTGCNVKPQELADFEPIVRPIAPKPMVYNSGSLYQDNSVSMFADPKPHRIGDILTIQLNERTSASKSAGTSSKKEDEITMAAPTIFGLSPTNNGNPLLALDVAPERDFSGEADSSQSNSLTGEITVTVVDILPNGNLVVQGEKWFTLNIRAADVSPENTLPSSKLADAQITYSGEGFLADANNQGWFGQFMSSLLRNQGV